MTASGLNLPDSAHSGRLGKSIAYRLLDCPDWRLHSANSSLAAVRQPNDRTEVTLPDAEIDYRGQLGPKQPVRAIGQTPVSMTFRRKGNDPDCSAPGKLLLGLPAGFTALRIARS